jgi:hypothetical protein
MVVVGYPWQLPEVLLQPFGPRMVSEAGTPIFVSVRVADIAFFDCRGVYDVDELPIGIGPGTSVLLFQ